jgi:hypothetical protein
LQTVSNSGEEPRTLLRRLLKEADTKADTTAEQGNAAPKTPARKRTTGEASPVRPPMPESVPTETPTQLAPSAPQPRSTQTQIAPAAPDVQERLKAEEALESLRAKTAQVANEFNEGKINHAQFTAMYAHFNEKRQIIETMLARNPDTQAWQAVARPGQTTFLRQHFEARVLAYAIYDNGVVDPDNVINAAGPAPMTREVAKQILTAIAMLLRTRTTDKPMRALRRQIEDGQWIAIIPGTHTSAIALFSLEPSAEQFDLCVDMHRDFERANRLTLERGIRAPEQLVFPHRALFEKPGQADIS